MLKVENYLFDIKSSEIDIRQRMYQGDSIITIQLVNHFFPSLVEENIVSGMVEINVDISEIHSLKELENRTFDGNIGSITISVNNTGDWEYIHDDKFSISFGKLNQRRIEILLNSKHCIFEGESRIVSLYTTSTDEKELSKQFDLKDFYAVSVKKEVGKSTISKYFVKE